MIKVLEFGIVRLAKTSFSREQRSLMSTSTSSRTFAHKSGNYRVNSVACATQLVTPGPTNLAKEATNEVEEENEVHTSTEGVSMQSKGGSSSFSRKDWKKVEDECGLMDVWKKDVVEGTAPGTHRASRATRAR